MKNASYSLFVVCALAGVGCGDLPQPSVANGSSSTDSTDTDTLSAVPDPPTVSLSATTNTTSASIVVSGTTEAAHNGKYLNVVITGGVGDQTITPADQYGNFCTPISLKAGTNVLTIKAQREDGSTSDAVKKTVNYAAATTTTTSTRAVTTVDAALYKVPGTNVTVDNSTKLMTDDDDTTYTEFAEFPSIYIDLGATYEITDIELVFPDTSYAPEGYEMYYATTTSPTRPVTSTTAGWTALTPVEGSDGGTDTFSYDSPFSARWFALNVTDTNAWWSGYVEISSIRLYGTKVSSDSTGGSSGGDNTVASCQ